jgi:uncharacterized protein involved in outer membrane biogenesis
VNIETAERPEVMTAPANQSPRGKPRKVLKRVAAAVGLLALLLVVVIAFLPSAFWRWVIIHEVSSATRRPVTIDGDVRVHLFSLTPEISVEGLAVGNAPWADGKKLLSVKKFDATLSLKSLLRFHVIFPQVTIDAPALDVQRDSSGRTNWDFSAAGRAKPKPTASAPLHLPVIQELKLTNGTLTAVDRVRKLTFNGQISVQETQNTADNHALKLRGSGTLNAKPFRLAVDGEPLIGVDPSKTYGFETTVTAADIKLNARASIAHPFDLAQLRANFHVSGSDLADVYYLTGLALPNTPPYDVAGTLVRDNLRFSIDDFAGKLGSSDITGKIAIDTSRERPKLEATLVSKQLNLADLAAPLGTEATPAGKSNTLARPTPAPAPTPPTLLLPDADLQVQRVRAMDADVHFDAAAITAAKNADEESSFPPDSRQWKDHTRSARLCLASGRIRRNGSDRRARRHTADQHRHEIEQHRPGAIQAEVRQGGAARGTVVGPGTVARLRILGAQNGGDRQRRYDIRDSKRRDARIIGGTHRYRSFQGPRTHFDQE